MEIEERITVDEEELFQYLDAQMERLQPFCYDKKYRQLLGDGMMDKLNEWSRSIRRQKNSPINVVVCGEFKRGKSTLINAILKEDVVTTNITTETITVNRISYGEHSNEIILKGGKRIRLADDELKCESLKEVMKGISQAEQVTMLELKRPLEILKDITIIDTPGLGDSIKDFTTEVEYALRQADAVIYVFSALYPLSVQEQFFIKTAIKPQVYTELFFVANSCDMLEEEEDCKRLEQTICRRMETILPKEKPLMVSALEERLLQLGKDPVNQTLSAVLSLNFEQLRAKLKELIECKKNLVVTDRIQRMLMAMIYDLQKELDVIHDGVSLNMKEFQKRQEEFNQAKQTQADEQRRIMERIDREAEIYRSRATDWISELIDCMEDDVKNISVMSAEDIRTYYSVFCVDTIQIALNKCKEYFAEALYDELEHISAETAKKWSMNAVPREENFQFSINSKTWTKGDTLGFVLNLAGNYLSILNPLLIFTAGTMRESAIKKSTPDLIKSIEEQYPQLRASIIPAISKSCLETAEEAKKQMQEYFAEKIAVFEEQIVHAERVAGQDHARKLEIKAAADEITEVLEQIRTELEEWRIE